jgi:hypothetical protein
MLKYDINAIVAIEEVTGGMTLVQIFAEPSSLERMSLLRKLYWAGRTRENPKLTLSGAGDELQDLIGKGKTIAMVVEDITKALMATGIFPDKPEEAEGNPTSPA